jgi:transcriptional antiterminator RfaH
MRETPCDSMLRWYLIRAKPSSETIAEENLLRQGYPVYLPRLLQRVQRRGRALDRIVPLFPQYLFLQLDEGRQSLGPVRFSTGVAEVVRFGSRYARVPDWLIGHLQQRADPASGLHRVDCASRLASGAPVTITAGPFKGIDGIFDRQAGADRVLVLLHLLGEEVAVNVPAHVVTSSRAA